MTQHRFAAVSALLIALSTATTLAACDQPPGEKTAGQKVDRAVTQAERKVEDTTAAVVNKAKDAVITTSVNTELTKDPQLSALRIDVDTVDGKVALRGTAPDEASRERATTLAARVDGVKSVNNELKISPKG
jgi:hyperosmotically inducible protein